MSAQRILGIDPGLNRTGWGVIESHGSRLAHIAHGVIRVPAGSLPERLAVILTGLDAAILAHAPQRAAVELVFVNVNPKATLLLGQARGAALCAAVRAGLPVGEHAALRIKQAVCGYGMATKAQVQRMVQKLLALETAPVADAADALACAICEAHSGHAIAQGARAPAVGRARRSRAAWRALALPTGASR